MIINDRIKMIRKDKNLTQIQFATKLGIKQSSLSNIESGETSNIDERNIMIICQLFNVNEEWLRTGVGKMYIETEELLIDLLGEHINTLTEIEKKAVAEYIKLPVEHRAIIMDFIKKMVAN